MGRPLAATIADVIATLDERLRAVERGRFRAPAVAADPSPVGPGDVWIRTDTGQLCWHDGTTIRRISGA